MNGFLILPLFAFCQTDKERFLILNMKPNLRSRRISHLNSIFLNIGEILLINITISNDRGTLASG
jgi:hypothetical protein